jgi:hypothetical protein
MSTLSPIRMDSWRQQAMLTRGRSLPDIGNASTLHPNLRKLVERKVPLRMPAVGKISDTPTDPVTRRKAVSQPGKELEAHPKYRPSPWARSVTTKVEKRGKASEDHENVSAPWRRGYKANETQRLGMGKDLLSAEPMMGEASRPTQASAVRNYSLYVTYKSWLGPTCYTPMPSTRGSLSTRGTAGSILHSRGSLVTPMGLASAGSGSTGGAL